MTYKIAVVTSFPYDYFNLCAAEMLASFKQNWPEDIKIFIQLDELSPEQHKELNNNIVTILGEDRTFIASLWDKEQKEFLERWREYEPGNYMFDVVRFSHKVFAVEKCADALKDSYDYMIWLDADVITNKRLSHDWLKDVLPAKKELCSYLGRNKEDNLINYSECGFVAYNLKAGAYAYIKQMKEYYTTDKFKEIHEGWTDCHVFDAVFKDAKKKNLSEGVKGTDVWPFTRLGEKMEHRKGNRKVQKKVTPPMKPDNSVVDINKMQIKTKNCLDHDKIVANVKKNLSQIRNWITLAKPTDREIVICAAGPSLPEYIDDIKERQKNGALVVAVKHSLETLKRHNVKPWACVLLDPRQHVEAFIKKPDPDVIYFVASMCDPTVVKTLNDNKCTVVGYHALVNAGEVNELIGSDLPVSGGSATSTRSLAIFADMFGYRDFHLYGYDLCHYSKPNMEEKTEDGNQKYLEVNLGTYTYGNKYITKTFWTEGQFLAQSNELKDLCKDRKDLNINIYGDGIAGWIYKHTMLYERYKQEYNENIEKQRAVAPTMEDLINAYTRGNALSRTTK